MATTRQNFSWGSRQAGVPEGLDTWGSTNNWSDQQWQDYDQRQGAQTPSPAPGGLDAPMGGPNVPDGPRNPNPGSERSGPYTGGAQHALTGTATPGQQTAQGQPATVTGAFQQALLNRLAPGPINAQNPEIAPAIQANQLAEQRGQERQRSLLAERAAAGGYSGSSGFDTQLRQLEQGRTQREGEFEANAIQGLGNRQAQELMAALGLGGQMLGQQDALGLQRYGMDQSNALQRYGIDTDAQLRREGYGLQGNLGGRELDIRDRLGSGQLNLGLLAQLLGNEQFGQQLGANLGMFGADLNFRTMDTLLNKMRG